MNFFETVAGRDFCERISESLRTIAKELKRANDLKEVELTRKNPKEDDK